LFEGKYSQLTLYGLLWRKCKACFKFL
jgi:hypothetical protein